MDSEWSFGAVSTALLLPNPICLNLSLHLSPSLRFRCCVSLSADSSSALLRCLVLSWGDSQGIPCSHHSSTPHSTRVPCLYTHKSACHFYCLLLFLRVMFSPLWCYFLFILSPDSTIFQSVCLWVAILSIRFKFNLMMILPSSLSVVAFD